MSDYKKTVKHIPHISPQMSSSKKEVVVGTTSKSRRFRHEPKVESYHLLSQKDKFINLKTMRTKNLSKLSKKQEFANNIVRMGCVLIAKKKELLKKTEEFNSRYVMVSSDSKADVKDVKTDVKPFEAELKLIDIELQQIKDTIKSGFGDQIFKINLVEFQVWNSDSGGTVNSTIVLNPATITEFISCAAIFDEFRILGGHYQFAVSDYMNAGSSVAPYGVMAYDPAYGVVSGTTIINAQLQQHMMVPYSVILTGGTNTLLPTDKFHRFDWKVPAGTMVTTGAAAGTATNAWQPTVQPTFQNYGWMKYNVVSTHGSTTQLGGLNYYHAEFRCRV